MNLRARLAKLEAAIPARTEREKRRDLTGDPLRYAPANRAVALFLTEDEQERRRLRKKFDRWMEEDKQAGLLYFDAHLGWTYVNDL